MNMLYMKNCQSLNKMIQKKLLNGCYSTLEFFLVECIYVFYWVRYIIFSILTKNALKNFKLKKKVLNHNILVASNMIF